MCSYVQYLTLPTWRAGSTLCTFVPEETEEGGCRQVIHRSDCFEWRHLMNGCGLPFGPGLPSIPSTPVLPSVPLTPGTPSVPLTPESPKDVKWKDVGSRTLLYCSLMLGREGDRGRDSNLACVEDVASIHCYRNMEQCDCVVVCEWSYLVDQITKVSSIFIRKKYERSFTFN